MPSRETSPRVVEKLQSFARAANIAVILVGCLVFIGWILDIGILKSVLPGLVTMKATTALCFILAGAALWLLRTERDGRRSLASTLAGRGCALSVLAIGGLTLSQDILGLDFGIDQMLLHDSSAVETSHPGRMSPATALNFLLVGSALLLLNMETRPIHRAAPFFIIPVFLISLLGLIGYLYNFHSLYKIGTYTSMAVHTAVTFLLLSAAVLAARPDGGLMALFTNDHVGGILSRRLLPAAIVLPVFLGWLRLQGQRAELFDAEFGLSLLVSSFIILFVALIWATAKSAERTDAERKQASIVEFSEDAIISQDLDGIIRSWNKGAEQLFGCSAQEAIGRSLSMLIPPECEKDDSKILGKIRSGENIEHYETIRVKKDRTRLDVSLRASPIKDAAGNLIGISIIARDITERKRAEKALRVSQEQYKLLVDQARDIIYRTDDQGRFTFVNPIVTRIMGYSPQELLGRRFIELIRPAARAAAERFYGWQFVRKTPSTYYEFPALTKDGREIWFGQNAQTLLENDRVVGFHAVTRDITERKRAEEALQQSEERFRSAFGHAAIGMALVSTDGRWLQVNPALCDIVGYSEPELLSTTFQAITHPDDLETDLAYVRQMLAGEIRYYQMEKRYIHKRGHSVWILLSVSLVRGAQGNPLHFISLIQDITERKREEAILQALLEGTASVTGEQFFPALVRTLARTLGVRHALVTELLEDEQPRLRMLAIWMGDRLGSPIEYDLIRTPCEKVIKLGEAYYQHSVQGLFPEDKDLVALGAVSYLGIALVSSSGKTIGHLCILDDKPLPDEHHLTPLLKVFASRAAAELERKRAETEIQRAHAFLGSIVENIPNMIFVKDAKDLRFVRFNKAGEELLGYNRHELIGKSDYDFFSKQEADFFTAKDRTVLDSKHLLDIPEEPIETNNLGTRILHTKKIPILDKEGRPQYLLGISEDITERKQSEEVRERLVAELAESRSRFEMFFRQTPSAIAITTVKEGRFLDLNRQAELLTGYSRAELIGHTTQEMNLYVDPAERADIVQKINKTRLLTDLERQIRNKSGEIRTAVFSLVPIQMGSEPCLLSIAHDITERKRAESLLAGEKRVLEMISSGATLSTVLESIVHLVEEQRLGMLCSILLLDTSGKTLRHGAAPSLPPSYVHAVDGIAIGPTAGSCGTAAFLEKPVIVSDISSDPLWATYRDLALPHGLHACWSVPIFSSDGLVLGTFAQYHRVPQSPTDNDLRLVERFCHLASIAIERVRAEEVLRDANQALRTLSQRLLQVQEEDRRTIARDLHDEIGQSLTAIKLNVERARRTSDRAARDGIMKDCGQITDNVLEQVRDLSLNLHPSILDDLGLAYALKWYADRQAERAGLKIQVAADLSLPRLSLDIEIACFRIAQEALTNVVRHAHASQAGITLKRGTTTVELCIQDDGTGFVVDKTFSTANGRVSVGLTSMQERAKLLGGTVKITSALRCGTKVCVTLPLLVVSPAGMLTEEVPRS